MGKPAFDKDTWRELDLNVDSLWLFEERDRIGKHSNVYHGNFIPQVPRQLISRYTQKGDLVLELFSGSGTTLFECERLERNYVGFDINPEITEFVLNKMDGVTSIDYQVHLCDVTDTSAFSAYMGHTPLLADLLIAHPPYLDIVRFTDIAGDLSRIDRLDVFLDKLVLAFDNALQYVKKGAYIGLVMGDIYRHGEVIPLGFYTMYALKKHFNLKLKGTIVKNIEGNRGKLGVQNIWKYRAVRSDYFLFKHEYIFVFKKEF